MTTELVAIVTVIHNSGDVITGMLEQIAGEMEVIVVDNASTDGGRRAALEVRPGAIVIDAPNSGFGAGCNVGAKAATGDVVIFLNPDCRPRPGALDKLAAAARADRRSIFGPALLDDDGAPRHNLRRRSRPYHEILEQLPSAARWTPGRWRRDLPVTDPRYLGGGEVDYLQGACLAIDRSRFLTLGGFDEDYFLYSEEETLCEAVIRAGGRCVYEPAARVAHAGATSTAKVSRFAICHAYRSRAIFYRKRYGEVLGLLSVLGIALTAAISWCLFPLIKATGGRAAHLPRTQGDALRGLVAGSIYRLGRLR